MRRLIKVVTMIAAGGLWMPAFGGTVITTNLPANAAIINISGTQDGVKSSNGDKSL